MTVLHHLPHIKPGKKQSFKKKIMLKFMLLALIQLWSINSFSQGISFFKGSWDSCLQQSKEQKKYVFVDAYTDWCGWCTVMDKKTFTDAEVGRYFDENFVAYKMDMERGVGIKIGMKYRISGYPAYLYFTPDGALVHKDFGYRKPDDFLRISRKARDSTAAKTVSGDVHQLDLPYPPFFVAVYARGEERKWPSKDTVVAYLKRQDNLFSPVNWAIMYRFGLDSSLNEFFLSNIDRYREKYGEEETNEKVASIAYGHVNGAVKDKNEKRLGLALDIASQHLTRFKEETKIYYQTVYYKETKNWTKYAAQVEAYIKKSNYSDVSSVNDYCWDIYKMVDDPVIVKKAVKWMEKAVSLEPEYMYLDTYAALLYKSGDLSEARKQAERAIKVGRKNKENVKTTRELLKEIKKKQKK